MYVINTIFITINTFITTIYNNINTNNKQFFKKRIYFVWLTKSGNNKKFYLNLFCFCRYLLIITRHHIWHKILCRVTGRQMTIKWQSRASQWWVWQGTKTLKGEAMVKKPWEDLGSIEGPILLCLLWLHLFNLFFTRAKFALPCKASMLPQVL